MPVVFVPGKGNIQFPDDMTPYQIQLAIEREILPGRKPETISAPKGPEASLSSFLGGIAEEFKAVPSATKNLIEKTIGTPGKAIESLATLGSLSALPQTLASSAQRSFMSAIGAAPPPPPPAPPKPAAPRLSERIDEAIGLTSPERRAEEARRAAIYGPLATRSRSEMEAATARTRADLARPQFDSVLGEGLYSGASSLVQMAPGLIGSAITRTPGPALANIAAITAGPTYQKYEERGATPEEALLGTAAETGIELGTEAIPLGAFVSKLGKIGFGKFLKEYLGRELPSELVATITQNAVDTAVANPDKTWTEYVNELPADLASTAVATLVPGTVLATAGKGLQIASKLAGRPVEEEEAAPKAPRTPPRAPPPPADMEALNNALGPVGGKITLQEPSGPQEYTFEGFDEDGSVVLADADGVTFSEDPDQIAAAIKVGAAEPEDGLGGMAFGMDITEGLDEEAAPPPPPPPAPAAKEKFTLEPAPEEESAPVPTAAAKPVFDVASLTGMNLPLDEGIPAQLKAMERDNTPSYMANLEREARQIAADQNAPSVSSLHFAEALNNAADRMTGRQPRPTFTLEPRPEPLQMTPEDAADLKDEEDFLARLEDDLSYIAETRAENAYEGEDPETKASYEQDIAELEASREERIRNIEAIKARYAAPAAAPAAEEAAPEAAPPAPPAAVGKADRATIPATREKVDVQYELQDLNNIRFAEDELQNRDRSRPASDAFITDFVNNFDPDGVGEDRSTDRGAPIINKDNTILSGNGRTMGLEEIYNFHPDKAEIYKESLRELGYDIEGIERPLLVRRLKSDVDERKFVTASNEPDVAALSPPEQAAQDARDILTPAVLSKYNGGDLKAAKNDAFVSAFLAEMNPQQRKNAMDDKGKVNAQTLKRIENALLYKAYGGAGRASKIFISKAMERSDDDTKTMTNSLVDVANDWIKFQQAIEKGEIDKKYDITNKLLEMVGTVSDIKASGNSVSGAMRSPDMVEPMDPFVRDILLAFHDDKTFRILSRKAIAEKLRAYTEVAANQQAAPDMFGKAETPSARDIWRRVDEGEGAPQSDLYASIEPIPVEQQQDVIDEARKVPSLSRGVNKLIKQRDQGLIDDAEFTTRVTELADFIDYMKDEKNYRVAKKGRVRDADRILSVLYDERRRGNVDPDSVDFIAWVLKGNPSLAEGLAVAIKKPGEKSPAGNYDDVRRLMTLFKKRNADTTAVHELLHHTERMMPPDVQQAIRLAWLREFKKEEAKAKDGTPQKTFFQVLRAFHTREKFKIGPDTFSPQQGMKIAIGMFSDGFVPYSYYQYINPTEFWAVNATQIMQKRFGVSDSILGRLRNWLSELVEKAKGLFNLSAKSPLIKALDSLAKADGKFNSLTMLQEEGAQYLEPESKAPKNVTPLSDARDQKRRDAIEKDLREINEGLDDLSKAMENEAWGIPQMSVSIKKAIDGVYNRIDGLDVNAPADLRSAIDDVEERLLEIEEKLRAGLPKVANQNINKQQTELEKAEDEYEAARKALDKIRIHDDRFFMDRRTKERKAYEKEYAQLEKANDEAYAKFDKLYREQNDAIMNSLLNGTPAQMRNAVAKAQKPNDKIIEEGADLQKKNRGCD